MAVSIPWTWLGGVDHTPGVNGHRLPPNTPSHLATIASGQVAYRGEMTPSGAGFGNTQYTSADFKTAAAKAHAAAPGSKRAVVLMAPGKIVGLGGGSTQTTIRDVGVGRENNILFYPSEGPGTVEVVTAAAYFRNMTNVVIGGIFSEFGLNIAQSRDFFLWRCIFDNANMVSVSGTTMGEVGWYECGMEDVRVFDADSTAIRTTANAPIGRVHIVGCNLRAAWRTNGTTHTDTIQFSGDSAIGPVIIAENVIEVATNQGVIYGGMVHDVDQFGNVIIGGSSKYEPVPAGASPVGDGRWPVNGAPVGRVAIEGETWIGLAKGVLSTLTSVINCLSSMQGNKSGTPTSLQAGWTVDPSLGALTYEQIETRWPKFTRARALAFWNGTPLPEPDPDPEPEPEPEPGEPIDPENPPPATIAKPRPIISQTASRAVVISWPNIAGASVYDVLRDGYPGIVGSTPSLIYTDVGLEPSTDYVYRIRVTGSNGATSTSDPIPASTLEGGTNMALATVYGTVTDCGLIALVGKQIRLRFELSGPATEGGRLLITDPIVVIPNADGSFAVDLWETTLLSPASWYQVSASWLVAGQASAFEELPWKLRVPENGGPIGDLIVAPPPPGVTAWGFGPPDRDYTAYFDISGEQAVLYLLGAPA